MPGAAAGGVSVVASVPPRRATPPSESHSDGTSPGWGRTRAPPGGPPRAGPPIDEHGSARGSSLLGRWPDGGRSAAPTDGSCSAPGLHRKGRRTRRGTRCWPLALSQRVPATFHAPKPAICVRILVCWPIGLELPGCRRFREIGRRNGAVSVGQHTFHDSPCFLGPPRQLCEIARPVFRRRARNRPGTSLISISIR